MRTSLLDCPSLLPGGLPPQFRATPSRPWATARGAAASAPDTNAGPGSTYTPGGVGEGMGTGARRGRLPRAVSYSATFEPSTME
jgi:hypothetical protein